MTVALIAAVARDGTIGHQGRLPWHLTEDLQRFKRLTMGHALIMGRRTFASIGKPLPGRRNLVLTRRVPPGLPAGITACSTLEEALGCCRSEGETIAFIIGGAEVFRLALPLADRLFLTRVPLAVNGDTKFPVYDEREWTETHREQAPTCTFLEYVRQR